MASSHGGRTESGAFSHRATPTGSCVVSRRLWSFVSDPAIEYACPWPSPRKHQLGSGSRSRLRSMPSRERGSRPTSSTDKLAASDSSAESPFRSGCGRRPSSPKTGPTSDPSPSVTRGRAGGRARAAATSRSRGACCSHPPTSCTTSSSTSYVTCASRAIRRRSGGCWGRCSRDGSVNCAGCASTGKSFTTTDPKSPSSL